MKNDLRTTRYQKVPGLEALLKEMEELFEGKGLLSDKEVPKRPVVFIAGSPRSGSTLLYQYLAKSGFFAFPSNTISRFYYAPYIGARVQQLLFEADFNEEILPREFHDRSGYSSDLGKTQGPLAPHEFWYFWRRFFRFGEIQKLDRNDLEERELDRFRAELAALEHALDGPLLMKAMILNWDLDLLAELFPEAIFLHVERDTLSNARSLLKARERFFGEREKWYSFKPPEYHRLAELPPEAQVVGQVEATNRAVRTFGKEYEGNYLHIPYEEFCQAPYRYLCRVLERMNMDLPEFSEGWKGWKFEPSRSAPLEEKEEEKLQAYTAKGILND
jgi:LPS sulfotransferase NodH